MTKTETVATRRGITLGTITYEAPFPAPAGSPYKAGTWLVTARDADDPKGFITVARRAVLDAFGIVPTPAGAHLRRTPWPANGTPPT